MYPDMNSKSAKIYAEACKYLPGGNARGSVYMSPYQLYAARGDGFKITDVDGVERVDFTNNATSLIHGHAHPEVVGAVKEQLERGSAFTVATESEVRLAQILCERIPSVERVRFANSGTEAVMTAIKAARAFTGRRKFAKCEGSYHGSYDFAEVSQEPTPGDWGDDETPAAVAYAPGTPDAVTDNVIVLPYNNAAVAERLITQYKDELACIVVDLMPARLGLVAIAPDFLATLRRLTKAYGIVLIFDEVITLRVGYGGNQKEVGVTPDLTIMGKIIGGGFPVGAVGGRADIMSVFDPSRGKPLLGHSGTFNANPVTMVAGRRTLELLTPEEFERINKLGATARAELVRMFKDEDVPVQITGKGSLFCIAFHHQPVSDYRSAHAERAKRTPFKSLFLYLLNHGVLIGSAGRGAISTPMTLREIESLVSTVRAGVRELMRELVPA